MGCVVVDQVARDGSLVADVDSTLGRSDRDSLLLAALPGATLLTFSGERVVRFGKNVILRKQVTHLGKPWPEFKKRIQIPQRWLTVERAARAAGLVPRFVGIYHYRDVTIFVDFDPSTYVLRKANNSAAHVSTNDLFQAQTLGQFTRTDANGNTLTSVRSDRFATYLLSARNVVHPHLAVFSGFNAQLFQERTVDALPAVRAMHAAGWPDAFQAEWPGFYLEFRFDSYLRSLDAPRVKYQKAKGPSQPDFDLVFHKTLELEIAHYGDLKASTIARHESPGNDADNLVQCVSRYGRFWYVIYEHETTYGRHHEDRATIAWNEWKRTVGFRRAGRDFDPLSYASRFKQSVRFVQMMVLEVNRANFEVVLGEFHQGQQVDGTQRALKVMIKKRNIDNFLIYRESARPVQ